MQKAIQFLLFAWMLVGHTDTYAVEAKDAHVSYIHYYTVRWYRNRKSDAIGDTVEIYNWNKKMIYKIELNTSVENASAWTAPEKDYNATKGVLLTTHFSTGSSREFIIVAEIKEKCHKVLDVFSRKAGEAHPLEMVDLDGDSYPEIICVPSYEDFYGSNPGPTRAQVWKWSAKQVRYIKVRESAYSERLKPLTAQDATKLAHSRVRNGGNAIPYPAIRDKGNRVGASAEKSRSIIYQTAAMLIFLLWHFLAML